MKCLLCDTGVTYGPYCKSCSGKLPNYGVGRDLGFFELSMSFFLCPTLNLKSDVDNINGLFYKDVFDHLRKQVDAIETTVKFMVGDEYEMKKVDNTDIMPV